MDPKHKLGEHGRPGGSMTISGPGPESTDAATLVALNNTEIDTLVFGGSAITRPAPITITADSVSLSNRTVLVTTSSGERQREHCVERCDAAGECESGWDTHQGRDGVFFQTPS